MIAYLIIFFQPIYGQSFRVAVPGLLKINVPIGMDHRRHFYINEVVYI